METLKTVTMVRFYLPEASHSTRKAQLERVLNALNEELHVHGVTLLPGIKEPGVTPKLHFETVGDVLRKSPDSPLIIELFDETPSAAEARRLLGTLVPDGHAVYWQATWAAPNPARSG